jgi:hypothetical protein
VPSTKGKEKKENFFSGLLKNYTSQIILVYLKANNKPCRKSIGNIKTNCTLS